MTLTFRRTIANKLAGVFAPSLIIVLITFSTFWLGPASISDRITVGITALLAVVTQFGNARSELPPISYITVSSRERSLFLFFLFFTWP